MRRIFVLGLIMGLVISTTFPAKAQYTTKTSSSTKTVAPVKNQNTEKAGFSYTTKSTSASRQNSLLASEPVQVKPVTQSASDETGKNLPSQTQKTKAMSIDEARKQGNTVIPTKVEEIAFDMPDFSVFNADGKEPTVDEKLILLQEFARKQEAAVRAKEAEEQARKDAIAHKLATEKPRPGYMFDEEANEVPVPQGEVWLYTSEFEQGDVYGRVYCTWKTVLQNRGDTPITSLKAMLIWPSYSIEMSYSDVKPNESKMEVMMKYSPNCSSLRTKPRIEVKECVIGPVKADDCSKYIKAK